MDGPVFDKVLGRAQAGTTWLRSINETKQNPKIWSLGAAGNLPGSRDQTTGKRVGRKEKKKAFEPLIGLEILFPGRSLIIDMAFSLTLLQ